MLTPEPVNDMATALDEARDVMCGAVEELLAKTGMPQNDAACDIQQCGYHDDHHRRRCHHRFAPQPH